MKNALTFCGGGQLSGSYISVVPVPNQSLGPGAASSHNAPSGQSLDFLWGGDFKSCLQRLAPMRLKIPKLSQGYPKPAKPSQCAPPRKGGGWGSQNAHLAVSRSQASVKLGQAGSSVVKPSQAVRRKKRLFISCRAAAPSAPMPINPNQLSLGKKQPKSRPKPAKK